MAGTGNTWGPKYVYISLDINDSLCPAETYSLLGKIECGHIKTYGFENCERDLREITGFCEREHSRESD